MSTDGGQSDFSSGVILAVVSRAGSHHCAQVWVALVFRIISLVHRFIDWAVFRCETHFFRKADYSNPSSFFDEVQLDTNGNSNGCARGASKRIAHLNRLPAPHLLVFSVSHKTHLPMQPSPIDET